MTSMLTSGATIQSNMTTSDTAQRMSVDMSGLAHIMSVLTNLYSNPSLAVLREYSVNALDAHVEAGTTRPIEVTLPSELNPALIIKDYGIGMVEADIYCVYAQYGASTKRDDETQVGGFGLGSKSALALTQQFTVTAVKDGRKTVVHFAQGSDGVGTVDTLLRSSTDEPNGVEISVPVSDVNAMVREAEGFFSVWKPNTVLVNGQAPKTVWDSATKVADGVYLLSEEGMGNSGFRRNQAGMVVMGSVPYPMDMNIMHTLVHPINPRFSVYGERLLIEVGIGDVEITPSRESLNYSDRTKTALTQRMRDFFANIAVVAQADVNAATTPLEAVKRAAVWRNKHWMPSNDYKWNDLDVPATFTFENAVNVLHFANGSRTTTVNDTKTFSVIPLQQVRVMIHGVETEEHRTRATRDIRDFVKGERGTLVSGTALYTSPGTDFDENPWLADVEGGLFLHVSIDDLMHKAREYRRSQRQARGTSTARVAVADMIYPVLDTTVDPEGALVNMPVSDLLTAKGSIYYIVAGARFAAEYLSRGETKNFFVSLLPANSLLIVVEGARTANGLLRRIPAATPIRDEYAQAAKAFVNSMSEMERRLVATDAWAVRSAYQAISALRPRMGSIHNKEFLALMRGMETLSDDYNANSARSTYRMFERFASMNRTVFDNDVAPHFREQHTLLAGYPLLSDALRRNSASETLIAHAIAYLNAIA